MTRIDESAIRAQVESRGQGHLFTLLDQAQSDLRQLFFQDLAAIDWDLLERLKLQMQQPEQGAATDLAPAPSISKGKDETRDAEARARGEELLRAGKVAAFVVAGGQGSRLGFAGPKGKFPATPVRSKTLFEIFGAKIKALNNRYQQTIPWYVMTSRGNHDETLAYFQEKQYFGLDKTNVMLFSQDMLPAMDGEGRLLLQGPGELFMSPNGHGGSLLALRNGGAIADMKQRRVEQLFYFQIDNPLAVMADPVFVGYHDLAQAEMSTKVVAKRNADEKVGVVGLVGGQYGVIEYSDLSADERCATDDSGQLRFKDGNIAIHMIRRDFVESMTTAGLDLPYHVAKKDVPDIDPLTGSPRKTAGVKFETFVFDALARCQNSVVLEVDRAVEFAPIKNAEGEDSPATSTAAQVEMFASWLELAGQKLPRNETGMIVQTLEIDPIFADSAEALSTRDLPEIDSSRAIVLE